MAPLQGFTDAIFRQLFCKYYGGIDRCYTPFIRLEHGNFRVRDIRDIESSQDNLSPQILPGSASEFNVLVDKIESLGYTEIDINMGCPFPPVMAHGRGCALLNIPEKAIEILREARQRPAMRFSLKMRLGYADTTQWRQIIDAVNDTELTHVTVHARYGKQQYKGECDMEQFADFVAACRHKVIYNGDICTPADAEAIGNRFSIGGVMIGRGLLADLNLPRKIKGLEPCNIDCFRQLHAELVEQLTQRMDNDRQVVDRMKPYWEYLFPTVDHKMRKRIKKTNKMSEYSAAVAEILHQLMEEES